MKSLTNYLLEALVNKKVSDNKSVDISFDANIRDKESWWSKETLEELASKLTSEEKDVLSGISVNDNWRVKAGDRYYQYFFQLDFTKPMSKRAAKHFAYEFIKNHTSSYDIVFHYKKFIGMASDDERRRALITFIPDDPVKTDKILIAFTPYIEFKWQ